MYGEIKEIKLLPLYYIHVRLVTKKFRITNGAYNGSRFSPQTYSGWNGGSVARITTYSISKFGTRFSEGAGAVTTYMAVNEIFNGNPHPISYLDAGVGTVGLGNTLAPVIGGSSVPLIGQIVALYSWVRFWGDLGYNYPVSTWFRDNETK